MAQSARLDSIIIEKNNITSAINNFRGRFNQLPGDMRNATTIFTTSTSNGNGDGQVWWYHPSIDVREYLQM